MKKSLLSLLCAGSILGSSAQVYVEVLTPPSVAGSYVNVYAADNDWGVADLTDPVNSRQGLAVMAVDSTAGDSLMCEAAVNGAELAGNIAVLYRGVCPFSNKALNAQNEGAIAVVIINNTDDMAFTMLGDAVTGPQVTIPVVMISETSGALLRDEILAGSLNMFIGNNFGAYPYNVGMERHFILQPPAAATSELLAADASELSVPLGAWVRNYGSSTDGGVSLNATVTKDGTVLYDETSGMVSLASGDSAWFTLPEFSQPDYEGYYVITYTAQTSEDDGFEQNNVVVTSLTVGNVFSYAQLDPVAGTPISDQSVLAAPPVNTMTSCIFFSDPNAERVIATGLHVMGNVAATEDITDRLMEVTVYLWPGAITTPIDLPVAGSLVPIGGGEYYFLSGDAGNPVFVPFSDPVMLENNENYLFCMDTYDAVIRHGWNSGTDYEQHLDYYTDPVSMIAVDGAWYNGFTNLGGPPSIGVQLADVNSIGINELGRVELTPFPNPTENMLMIPMSGQRGAATLQIFDMAGIKVAEKRVAVSTDELLTVDLAGISNGAYLFQLNFENGNFSNFRVVVSK